jgi:predicted transposase YbfD/YdcC
VLLEPLDLKGCIVTIDAMGCQKDIAAAVRQRLAFSAAIRRVA